MSISKRGPIQRSRLLGATLGALIAATMTLPAFAGQGPSLGQPVDAEEVSKWDISIAPDGATLPAGQGDSIRGEEVYDNQCRRCHGRGGKGGEGLADRLVGGAGSLTSDSPMKTVGSFWPYATTVFDYVRRAMPYDRPMSLSNDDVYSVTAYILAQNEIIEAGAVMDAETLPKVKMPNRDGFILYWPEAN